MTNFSQPHQTSLGSLTDGEWNALSNTWARGVDYMVSKVGRKWMTYYQLGGFPLFKTKREACEAVDNLILAEARHRAWLRNRAEGA